MTEPGKRARGRPRSVDRQSAVDLAMDTYWRLGLSALSLNEMCKRVGLSKPALYREFGGEDGLQAAALATYRHHVVRPMLDQLDGDAPLATMLEAAVVGLTSDRGTPPGCLFTKLRIAKSRLGPAALEAIDGLEREHLADYRALYQRGLDRGQANPELDAEFAAIYIDTQLASVLVQMGIGIDPMQVRRQGLLAMQVLVAR
ncbi:MAG: TetR family transcriptional regulator [Myxococcota bacterium]